MVEMTVILHVFKFVIIPATEFEQGLVARYQLEEAQQGLLSPDFKSKNPLAPADVAKINHTVSMMENTEPDFTALSKHCEFLDVNSEETKQKIAFMKIQSKVSVVK